MKFHFGGKDGGPESRVYMYGFESKRFGSALLLRFEHGSRDAYHSHAFHCLSWVVAGYLREYFFDSEDVVDHRAGLLPFWTLRSDFHQVKSIGRSWVLTFRGPWAGTWQDYVPGQEVQTLTHGRTVVAPESASI